MCAKGGNLGELNPYLTDHFKLDCQRSVTYGLWHDATQRTSRCRCGRHPGRGIARALGEAGAAVYCTGRSTRDNPSPYKPPETIEQTAEMIAPAGRRAGAIRLRYTLE